MLINENVINHIMSFYEYEWLLNKTFYEKKVRYVNENINEDEPEIFEKIVYRLYKSIKFNRFMPIRYASVLFNKISYFLNNYESTDLIICIYIDLHRCITKNHIYGIYVCDRFFDMIMLS